MNFTTSNFGFNSTFTYDEAKKYFENTSLDCKSDNDCLEGSSCIGNKCITTIYCKEGDDSKCSFFTNICNGKPCYKSDNKCNKNEDCLSGQCDNNKCSTQSYSYENLINEYSFSSFTYENARNYYNELNITCTSNDDCPNHTYCYDYKYPFEHRSIDKSCYKEEDCSSHCISHFYCKKDKSVCSFIKYEKSEIRFSSKISAYNNIFGLENREECKYDKECIVGRCGCSNLQLGNGNCREPSDSDSACSIPYAMFLGPLFGIECILILFIFVALLEKFNLKRKNLIKSKPSSLKCITITSSVIGVFLLSFYINMKIHEYLNNQPL